MYYVLLFSLLGLATLGFVFKRTRKNKASRHLDNFVNFRYTKNALYPSNKKAYIVNRIPIKK